MTLPARYQAPAAAHAFGGENRYKRFFTITRAYMIARLIVMERDDPNINADAYREAIDMLTMPTLHQMEEREKQTGHDVVALISLIEDQCDELIKPLLHYGLTSSDLVDNGHFQALAEHMTGMLPRIAVLSDRMHKFAPQRTDRAGHTHGQIADMTSWNWQMKVHSQVFDEIYADMLTVCRDVPWKSAGPVGHTQFTRGVDSIIVANMTMMFGYNFRIVPSTQVIPRDYQLRWAALYLRLACALENLALQVRLGSRAEIAEVREGGAEERVGSSAMPHKKNPIDSEKVCGLARVARGHFSAIAESTALWEDRDLTNSSLERVAVPDLAATVEHMLTTMGRVMERLVFDERQALLNIHAYPEVWSATMQTLAQKHFRMGPIEAGQFVRRMYDGYTGRYDDEGYFLGYMRSRVSNARTDYEPFIAELTTIMEGS